MENDREAQIGFQRDGSLAEDADKSENVKSSSLVMSDLSKKAYIGDNVVSLNNSKTIPRTNLNLTSGKTSEKDNEFIYTGQKIAQVLTLGAGGDNQAHVTRPKTANVNLKMNS